MYSLGNSFKFHFIRVVGVLVAAKSDQQLLRVLVLEVVGQELVQLLIVIV